MQLHLRLFQILETAPDTRDTVENQDPIAVTSHGRHIGYYIPAKPSPKEADFEALRTASRLLEAMLKKSGVTEDEIVAEFDALRKQERQKKSQP
ncbi:MAG: prevent-host-death protein [Symploca sp. SIO1A3]|nr:prevent-host-death protein [Symploca sp. SIO1A3]